MSCIILRLACINLTALASFRAAVLHIEDLGSNTAAKAFEGSRVVTVEVVVRGRSATPRQRLLQYRAASF